MALVDLEIGLSDEDIAVRETAHRFALEVLRPAGVELDRMPDPSDVIAPESVLWQVFEKYHQLGFGGLIRRHVKSCHCRRMSASAWVPVAGA